MQYQPISSERLLKELNEWIVEANHIPSESSFFINDVGWNLQDALPHQLVFYSLPHQEKTVKIFFERLKDSKASLVVVNQPLPPDQCEFPHLVIAPEHFIKAQKKLLDRWYPWPTNRYLVGITGTNGKTTTAYLAQQMANQMGHRCASLGTLGVIDYKGEIHPTAGHLTTPSFIELRKTLYHLFQDHEICFMEASSHALTLDRLYEIPFHLGAWTNLTQDHLDFHGDMENYFLAKRKIVEHLPKEEAVFIPKEENELIQKLEMSGVRCCAVSHPDSFFNSLPPFLSADFNRKNFALAYSLNLALWGKVHCDYTKLQAAPGRFELYQLSPERWAVIDFAHTPDALEKICHTITQSYPQKKLWVLFGCGGDRDATKRPLMGKVASQFAQQLIVTSDNPRHEKPESIIEDILKGIPSNIRVKQEVDRDKAIQWALASMPIDSILLLAGKGHEDYIIFGDEKIPFSEKESLFQHFYEIHS